MSDLNRRELFRRLLDGLAQATGAVVVARAVIPLPASAGPPPDEASPEERADRLAADPPTCPDDLEPVSFLNGGFRNAGFRNGAFRNAGFRNGAFRNGGFANGAFRNGGWRNLR